MTASTPLLITFGFYLVAMVAIGFIGQVSQIFFTGLCLCKTSTHRNLQSVRLKV